MLVACRLRQAAIFRRACAPTAVGGTLCEIRGIVPKVPLSTIKAGQIIELLVVTL
jgi:hypothetical protein